MSKTSNILTEICTKYHFESTHLVYLKKAVKVGENENGDILCTYIDRSLNSFYDVDHIVINVILDKVECGLYGNDYKFEFIQFKKENNYQATFIENMSDNLPSKGTIKLLPNVLDLILAEINESGEQWLGYQKQLQIRNRFYNRHAISRSDKNLKDNRVELTWSEKMDRSSVRAELDFLAWRRPSEKNHDHQNLIEMKLLGEAAYEVENERRNKIMMDIMNEIDF